ncbi:hypothetical protein MDIS_02885 [Mesomycoplasma dispar]|uniref:hypothetical protein n=1 Tax=Mesomycoplasma dispar TaxID=86660 RepID=UPI0005CC09DA|nr:hypothetical protein [Mesomycoplasma dispar]AJR12582.1 hypothetical protein MDIS_02885 [Mesomycoplasma dispar]
MIYNSNAAPDSKNLKRTCKDRMSKAKNSGNIGIRKMGYREFESLFLEFSVFLKKNSGKS